LFASEGPTLLVLAEDLAEGTPREGQRQQDQPRQQHLPQQHHSARHCLQVRTNFGRQPRTALKAA